MQTALHWAAHSPALGVLFSFFVLFLRGFYLLLLFFRGFRVFWGGFGRLGEVEGFGVLGFSGSKEAARPRTRNTL